MIPMICAGLIGLLQCGHFIYILHTSDLRVVGMIENTFFAQHNSRFQHSITGIYYAHMPIHKTAKGYKWGHSGKTYPTKLQAQKQAIAIYASGWKGKK
jgi:hypothetical protein